MVLQGSGERDRPAGGDVWRRGGRSLQPSLLWSQGPPPGSVPLQASAAPAVTCVTVLTTCVCVSCNTHVCG